MLLWVLLILLIIPALLGIYLGYRLMHPHRVSPEEAFRSQLEKGEISQEFIIRERRNFSLRSDYGYDISGFYFPGKSDKTVIFSHGISWNKLGSAKYLEYFFKEDWNIFLYDHRGAGESGGKYPSFGYYEKFDLKKVKDYATYLFPTTKVLGLFGESMGAATILQFVELDPSINFLVAVCPFSNLGELMLYHLKKYKIPDLLCPYILYFAEFYIESVGKFKPSDVSPIDILTNSSIPLFLSHGTKDNLVPYSMGLNLRDCRGKNSSTVFFSGEGSGHTPYLYLNHRDEFEKNLQNFLGKYS